MVRGRSTGRGRGRGASAAAASQPETTETAGATPTSTPATLPSATPTRTTPVPAARGSMTRGATAARATRGATARFRPKNIRRDEAERDALAREEEKKANERAADERRARGRSRLRSKRSRGDAMGSRGGGRVLTASGPFSSGFATSSSSRSGGWGGGGGSSGGGGGFGTANSAIGGSRAVKGTKEFNMIDSKNPQEARINADKLHNAAATPEDEFDSDDEAMRATLTSRGATIVPMGIYRKEHKETGVVVATTAELEAAEASGNAAGEEESLWVDGQGPTDSDTQPPETGNWQTGSSAPVKVKKEPGEDEDGDAMDIDVKPEIKKPVIPATEAKSKVLPQDPEEKMILSDLSLLASELGAISVSDEGDDAPADKDGRLYLFQFPPLLPPLRAVAPEDKVKPEPSDDTAMADAPMVSGDPVDLTQTPDGETAAVSDDEDPEAENGFMSKLLSKGGLVGKLNVRRSGRVELDWGGRTLEMSPATAMGFLTTAVIVEESDEKPGSDAVGGESVGMGKVMGRFVLAPVWEDEEEFEIPPEVLDVSGTS